MGLGQQASFGVKGTPEGDVTVWRGVPYAAPPVGPGRFRPPGALQPWVGARPAADFGPSSLSTDVPGLVLPSGDDMLPEDEDCLYLNVWSPVAPGDLRPVLVWIHGGYFVFGSGSNYDGAGLAAHGDVVVVTINYRLGPWGFLDVPTVAGPLFEGGVNVGLLDQVAALRWVQENISAFGGDPDRVTVIGQASGAMSIGALLAMPAAAGLFQRAILQSGGAERVQSRWRSRSVVVRLLDAIGLDYREAVKLQELPADDIRAAASTVMETAADGELEGEPYLPVVDGHVLPRHPLAALADGAARQIPLLISYCKEEANLFLAISPGETEGLVQAKERCARAWFGEVAWKRLVEVYQATASSPDQGRSDLLTALMFGVPAVRTAEAHQRAGGQVWMMRFDHTLSTAPFDQLGPCHGADLPFTWMDLNDSQEEDEANPVDPEDRRVATTLQDVLLAFARDGDPAAARVPAWPCYEPEHRAVMKIGPTSSLEHDPGGQARQAWDGLPLPLTLNLRRPSRSAPRRARR